MRGFLLDTNVISELTKPFPEPQVLQFLMDEADFWLSSVTMFELEFGVQTLPQGVRRVQLRNSIVTILARYEDHIISLGRQEAETGAVLQAAARHSGHTIGLADALIAGTAKVHDLCMVTRNVSDFQPTQVQFVNPWP